MFSHCVSFIFPYIGSHVWYIHLHLVVFAYISLIFTVNVGNNTIHGSQHSTIDLSGLQCHSFPQRASCDYGLDSDRNLHELVVWLQLVGLNPFLDSWLQFG